MDIKSTNTATKNLCAIYAINPTTFLVLVLFRLHIFSTRMIVSISDQPKTSSECPSPPTLHPNTAAHPAQQQP